MRSVALKGLWWRRTRSILTALAVVLGVAMISGTYVLTDTVSSAFDGIFQGSYKDTSAVISGREVVKESASGSATIPASLEPRVRAVPGVETASGAIFDLNGNSDFAKLLDKHGKVLGKGGAPTFAFGMDPDEQRFNPLNLTTGHWARGPGQVVIDKASAGDAGYHVGDRIGVSAQGPVRRYTISGIARFGNVDSLGGATIGVFDVPTAQSLLHKTGQFDVIFLAAKSGVSPAQLVSRVRPLLPASATIKTGAQQASANSKDTKEATKIVQDILLAFAGIALLVGSFVIFNTLSITVAQRIREFATLRTLGASRRQVMRSVLLEGFAIGLLASVAGLFLGIALAKGLNAVFDALGLSLPHTGTVLKSRTIYVSILVGTLVTLGSTIGPALRATHVPPVAAVREGALLPPSGVGRRSTVISIVTLAIGGALMLLGVFGGGATGGRLLLMGLGVLLLMIGVGLVAKRLVRPLAAVVGAPARRFGGEPGQLASGNATRNPARTASTAAALMIGLTLVTLVATLAAGLRNSDKRALERQVNADYVMTSKNGFDQFSRAAGAAVARAPGVTATANVRSDRAKAFKESLDVDGVDPSSARFVQLHWVQGSAATLSSLGARGAVLDKAFAKKHHVRVGSPFVVTTPAGRPVDFVVAGIQEPNSVDKLDPIFAKVIVSRAAFDAAFPRPKNILTFVNTAGGSSAAHTASLKSTLSGFPDARVETRAGWVHTRSSGINKLLNVLYVLLALSVVVSIFGMVNTLILSVFERTRELGMLRAIGMTRRQVRRMVRGESVITALIGAALGLPLGLLLAAAFTQALSDSGVVYSVPLLWLVVFSLVAAALGVLASLLPARRAARLNILAALQYE